MQAVLSPATKENAVYFGMGINRLQDITNNTSPFVRWNSYKRLVKHKAFERFLEMSYLIQQSTQKGEMELARNNKSRILKDSERMAPMIYRYMPSSVKSGAVIQANTNFAELKKSIFHHAE